MQNDLNKIEGWSKTGLLRFHPEKCKHMHRGKMNNNTSCSLHGRSYRRKRHWSLSPIC
ncbi:hypothetical protein LOTGIDRAFT_117987 [Lottia gigantea]|uniref:Uncharacterized protein n=1 Tax=Lottia gigantea TaxID=225164 RepID=V4ADC1_LOTGI|nr:hypothetical protein LOTGIDRAFT_117987 [Lottia gigantea]ESO94832.1 hypothetical protein LOTGIDRAFT_117987 [Lottia gigantea]